MLNQFLDFAQEQQNVWIVTNQQLLAWMRNPVPVSVSNNDYNLLFGFLLFLFILLCLDLLFVSLR